MVRNAGFFNAEFFEFIERADHLRIVSRVAEAAQRNNGIQNAGIDRSQTVRHLQAVEHPFLRVPYRQIAQRANVEALAEMSYAIEHQEEIAPRDELLVPFKVQVAAMSSANEEFVNTHLRGKFLQWLFGISDRQRDEKGARPRRNLVDVEPEPVGEEYDLRWNKGNGLPVILAEEAQINFGEGVALSHAAYLQYHFAGVFQHRMVGLVAHDLKRKIGFDRCADIRRSTGIDWPAAIVILVANNLGHRALHAAAVSCTKQSVNDDVIGFECGIGFELAAPVPIFMLLRKQVVARALHAVGNTSEHVLNLSEEHLRGMLVERAHDLLRYGRRRSNCFHDLRRQTEANILRHDLNLADIGEALSFQELHCLFHQDFRSGSARRETHGLYAVQPLGANVIRGIDQVRRRTQVG